MFDVLILGSGSAALSAALGVSASGLSCRILEKSNLIGGTSAMSGAGTWIPANHHAAEAGIQDSREEALAYLRGTAPEGWHRKEDLLWQAFTRAAPVALKFIEQSTPLEFRLTLEPDVFPEIEGGKLRGRMLSPRPLSKWIIGKYGWKLRPSTLPHLYTYQEVYDGDLYHRPLWATTRVLPKILWRFLSRSRAQGSALITGLMKGCLDNSCTFETNTRACELLVDTTGRVSGVRAQQEGQVKTYGARVAVVVACGGFEWNDLLMQRHFPGPIDFRGSPDTNEGDGQLMVEAIGGALDRMDQANIYPTIPTRYESKRHGLPILFQADKHAIVVDRSGKRFVSEFDFNIGLKVDDRDMVSGKPLHLPAWVIADKRILTRALPLAWYAARDTDWMTKADTLRELAEKIKIPADSLLETVARYNELCLLGKDVDYKRGESAWEKFKGGDPSGCLGTISDGPFIAFPFNRSILGAKGGARTNEKGQVVRVDGGVIPGLYAAGLSMANPIGTLAVAPGTTIGPNLTWGYICAESIVKGLAGDIPLDTLSTIYKKLNSHPYLG
ncbi:FAD-binding protein [Pseudomonas monteilii]|uniref:FAD-binding protein n=1 Tax=Pseudomonas monteilii TaxID=76759 RepID=UPI003D01EAE7